MNRSPLALANEGETLRAYRCESHEVENVADILVGGPGRDLTALSTRVARNERSCRSGDPVPGCQEGLRKDGESVAAPAVRR